jgi:hypothetical protein
MDALHRVEELDVHRRQSWTDCRRTVVLSTGRVAWLALIARAVLGRIGVCDGRKQEGERESFAEHIGRDFKI